MTKTLDKKQNYRFKIMRIIRISSTELLFFCHIVKCQIYVTRISLSLHLTLKLCE